MKENAVKAAISAAVGAACAYLGELAVPVIVLSCVMLIDYCSGLVKAWVTGSISSRTGVIGILKKVGYLAVVATGMAVDWIVKYGITAMGANLEVDFIFALPVIIWLVINECISILENVAECGAPVPDFLMKAIGKIKDKVEEDNNDHN